MSRNPTLNPTLYPTINKACSLSLIFSSSQHRQCVSGLELVQDKLGRVSRSVVATFGPHHGCSSSSEIFISIAPNVLWTCRALRQVQEEVKLRLDSPGDIVTIVIPQGHILQSKPSDLSLHEAGVVGLDIQSSIASQKQRHASHNCRIQFDSAV